MIISNNPQLSAVRFRNEQTRPTAGLKRENNYNSIQADDEFLPRERNARLVGLIAGMGTVFTCYDKMQAKTLTGKAGFSILAAIGTFKVVADVLNWVGKKFEDRKKTKM